MQKGHLGKRTQGGGWEAQERQETVKEEVDVGGDTQQDLKLYRHKSDEKEEDRKRNKKNVCHVQFYGVMGVCVAL